METKSCSKCKEVKPLEDFFFNKTHGKPDSWCKDCKRAHDRKRSQTPERKAYNKKIQAKLKGTDYFKNYYRRPEVRARKLAQAKEYRKNPALALKIVARRLLRTAKENGTIIQEPCLVCGKKQSQAHHEDYSKPLIVVWLCADCHRKEHALATNSQ